MSKITVRCTNLTKNFGRTPAVQGINLEVEEGGFLALLGPSGCGKTTLLRLIAGFEMPDRGTVAVGGRIVSSRGVFVPPEKRRVGIVFQDYALFTHLDVTANIAYGLPRNSNRSERVQEMLSLLEESSGMSSSSGAPRTCGICGKALIGDVGYGYGSSGSFRTYVMQSQGKFQNCQNKFYDAVCDDIVGRDS